MALLLGFLYTVSVASEVLGPQYILLFYCQENILILKGLLEILV